MNDAVLNITIYALFLDSSASWMRSEKLSIVSTFGVYIYST